MKKRFYGIRPYRIAAICAFCILFISHNNALSSQKAADKAGPKETGKAKAAWLKGVFTKETGVSAPENSAKPASGIYTLEDCIKVAVDNSLPLQIGRKNIKLAEMRVFEARRNMLPSASIVYEESAGRVSARRYIGRKQYIEGQQPVFHGGELFYGNKQAETNLEVTRNDYNRIRNDLILQVKKAYHSLAKAGENIKIQRDLSGEAEAIHEMVSRAFASGVISKLEMLNVSSQTSQIRFQLASAEGDMAVAELILKQAMNVEPKEKVEIEANLEFKKLDIDYEKTLGASLVNRPEMKINSLMVDYYVYGMKIAKAKGMVKVDLLGQWGLAKEEFTSQDRLGPTTGATIFDPDRKLEAQWYSGVKASMPFWGSTAEYSWTKEEWVPVVSAFQGTEATTSQTKVKILDKLDYYSDLQLAEIDLDKQRQELNKVKQDITLEVREACFGYEKALIQLETASNKVKYQASDLEFTKLKRGMDEVGDSAVMEGMIKLAQEKFGYMQALTDCHTSIATINKAVGVEDFIKDEAVPKSS